MAIFGRKEKKVDSVKIDEPVRAVKAGGKVKTKVPATKKVAKKAVPARSSAGWKKTVKKDTTPKTETKAPARPSVRSTQTGGEKKPRLAGATAKQAFHVAKRKGLPVRRRKQTGRRQTAKQNMAESLSQVLLRPRITEKATDATANRTYVFEVAVNATKRDVSKAVEHYYKVKPAKVNMVKITSKKRRNRNRKTFGQSSVGKKAYVFLKQGDSIEFV